MNKINNQKKLFPFQFQNGKRKVLQFALHKKLIFHIFFNMEELQKM